MLNSYAVLSKQTQIWSHTSPQTGSLVMRCRIFFFQTVPLLMPELSWGYKRKGDKAHQFVRIEKCAEASPVPLLRNPAVDVLLSTSPASSKSSHVPRSLLWLSLPAPCCCFFLEPSCTPRKHLLIFVFHSFPDSNEHLHLHFAEDQVHEVHQFYRSEMVISSLPVAAPQNYAVHLIPCVWHVLKRWGLYCFQLGKDVELQEMLNIDSCLQSKLFWSNWF